MTVFEIIDAFTFYGLDVILLAAATCLIVQILKISLLKKCQKKILTFLPFFIGSLLYAGYAALISLSFRYVADNYVVILEHGFSVGALATLIYVWYEQFVRNKKKSGATESVISTLIESYVPSEEIEAIASEIARAIEKDVTGDGAKKTAEILLSHKPDEVTENDIKVLSRLIIETLAHINTY
ncbi:MAG: hypothetical protein K2J54_00125 [Clostridia bacterium]|nr:hypothetical protein [Clostridia bacterium]